MKKRVFLALLLVAAAWFAGRYMTRGGGEAGQASAGPSEIHEVYELSGGARVEVRNISGPVTVETSETTTAEVHVSRSAKDKSDLDKQKIVIEHTPKSLVVRGEGRGARGLWRRLWGGGGSVETRVTLKLPRRVDFEASGVSGAVTVGEIDGALRFAGINGRLELAQAEGSADITGVNGDIRVALARVGQSGVELSGVNGDIEFRLRDGINADVDVHGLNGRVSVDVPHATMERRKHGSRVSAKIGAGGPRVKISGVNGDVGFIPAAPSN